MKRVQQFTRFIYPTLVRPGNEDAKIPINPRFIGRIEPGDGFGEGIGSSVTFLDSDRRLFRESVDEVSRMIEEAMAIMVELSEHDSPKHALAIAGRLKTFATHLHETESGAP